MRWMISLGSGWLLVSSIAPVEHRDMGIWAYGHIILPGPGSGRRSEIRRKNALNKNYSAKPAALRRMAASYLVDLSFHLPPFSPSIPSSPSRARQQQKQTLPPRSDMPSPTRTANVPTATPRNLRSSLDAGLMPSPVQDRTRRRGICSSSTLDNSSCSN
jgi:hypothetical protein